MKAILRSLFAAVIACSAPIAAASTYEGSWTNTTFDTTGALTIDFQISGNKVSGSFDLDGGVFGGPDPDAIRFTGKLNSAGNGSFTRKGTDIGDLTVTFDSAGKLDILIGNIPGGFLYEVRVDGQFDLKLETFTGTYEIDNAPSTLFAEGSLEAHVRKAPVIKGKTRIRFSGKKAKATIRVTSNVPITTAKAKASNGAKAKLVKKGPNYLLKVRKLTAKGSKVKVTVTNADGLKKSKTFKLKPKA